MEKKIITNPELLSELENFELDEPGSSLPFSHRLARDVGWSPAFAGAVCREYLRFVYLAMVAEGAVTPSEEVDQAWHLHLVYSRSYWIDLCGKVLKRSLHHGPSKGGDEEDQRYIGQYRQTLELYEREFGEKPRSDIWPDASERFRRLRYQMVAPPYSWVIRKDAAFKAVSAAFITTVMACLFLRWLKAGFLFTSGLFWVVLSGFSLLLIRMFYAVSADWNTRSEPPKRSAGSSGYTSDGGYGSSGCSSGCGSGCGGGCGS